MGLLRRDRRKGAALRKNPHWAGLARCRGLFRPYVELGYYALTRVPPDNQVGLCAHEVEHMKGYHRLKQIAAFVAVGSGAGVALTRWAGLPAVAALAIAMPVGLAASVALYIHHERYADTRAVEKTGFAFAQLVHDVLWIEPEPWELIVYGRNRGKRLMDLAEKLERERRQEGRRPHK